MDWFMGKGRRKDKDSPTPPVQEECREYMDEQCLRQKIVDADFYKLVSLPPCLDHNEWLATHTISFFNHVNLMYGVVSEFCTADVCSSMTGPGNVQFWWYDEKGKKVKYTAPQYVDYVTSFIQKTVSDDTVFPTKFEWKLTHDIMHSTVSGHWQDMHSGQGSPLGAMHNSGQVFPNTFEVTVKKIHKYLFHILAHIYHTHFKELQLLTLNAHMNTLFTHFTVFNIKFDLIDEKETEVLSDLIKALIKHLPDPNQNEGSEVAEISRT